MKLWIRSQDKESLAIIKSLCYVNHGGENVVMGGEETTFDIVLGKYHTKERCFEIIDEIQGILISDFAIIKNLDVCDDFQKRLKNTKGISYSVPNEKPTVEYHSLSAVVYEMPEK